MASEFWQKGITITDYAFYSTELEQFYLALDKACEASRKEALCADVSKKLLNINNSTEGLAVRQCKATKLQTLE